jgi:hypothetical protein
MEHMAAVMEVEEDTEADLAAATVEDSVGADSVGADFTAGDSAAGMLVALAGVSAEVTLVD